MLRLLAAVSVALAGLCGHAAAQDYPNRPIRLIVGFPPGAGTDATARVAAEFLSPRLGQTVVVENKGGAGTAIAADFIAKSKNDGYTLFWGTSDSFAVLPAVKKDLAYKPFEDFEFVATTARYAQILVVNSSRPYSTMKELVAFAKANPGKIRYSSVGVGSAPHLAMAVIAKATGTEMIHVPYTGAAPALTSAVAGHVDMLPSTSAQTHIQAGTLRPIVAFGAERHYQYPDLPTLRESGIAASLDLYLGVVAPAGTPEPVLARLRKELKAMSEDPKVAERFRAAGYQPLHVEGAGYKELMAKDLGLYSDVAKSFNITLE
jgi:tripartite-type tricarboxylate transporter receptor subunit TctC